MSAKTTARTRLSPEDDTLGTAMREVREALVLALDYPLATDAAPVVDKLVEITVGDSVSNKGKAYWKALRDYLLNHAVLMGSVASALAKAGKSSQIRKEDICAAADLVVQWGRRTCPEGESGARNARASCRRYEGSKSIGC